MAIIHSTNSLKSRNEMNKYYIFSISLLFSFISLQAGLKNPALNPVRFMKAPTGNNIKLISNGKADFAIVIDKEAESHLPHNKRYQKSIGVAVDILKDAFKKTAKITVPIIDASDSSTLNKYKYWLVIGKNSITKKLGISVKKLPKEGFIVKTFDRGIVIVGQDGSTIKNFYNKYDGNRYRLSGTVWATMDFIERFLGVRYYFPGPGIIWPKIKNLDIEPVAYKDWPRFNTNRWRWDSFGELGRNSEKWPKAWKEYKPDWQQFWYYWRQTEFSRLSAVHQPQGHNWARVHLKDKPYLFYKDKYGKRWADPKDAMNTVFDITNKKTAEQYVKDCLRFYNEDWQDAWIGARKPTSESITFGQTDKYMVLENARSKDLIDYSRGKYGTMSDVNARFYIWLCEIVKKKLPGKKVMGWAYADYRLPPRKNWKFPDNFELDQCNLINASLYGNKQLLDFDVSVVKRWSELLGRPVGAHLYLSQKGDLAQTVSPEFAQDFYLKADKYLNNRTYYYARTFWGSSFMSDYLMLRLEWNPKFDLNAARNESYKLLYGKAAPYIKEFYDTIFERWKKYYLTNFPKFDPKKPDMLRGSITTLYGNAFNPAIIDKMEKLFKQSKAVVGKGSVEEKRLDFLIDAWKPQLQTAKNFSSFSIKNYKINELGGKIYIDGSLKDAAWKKAKTFTLTNALNGNSVKYASKGRMLWDKKGIYIALEMPENNPKGMKKKAVKHDEGTYNDDCVEIFISQGKDKADYAQLCINSLGTIFDGHKRLKPEATHFVSNWNWENAKSAAKVGKDKWVLEVFLPFRGIEQSTPRKYSRWHFNIIRNKLTEPKEISAFSRTMGNNHNINYFGRMKFMGRSL
jgi:Carbohydrate family 9 binding domain-like/Domain of unknown function (DUF4838)